MLNIRTDFASLIPPKDLSRVSRISPLNPIGLSSEGMNGISEKELDDAALRGVPVLKKGQNLFGGAQTYCGYDREPTSEADVRTKLQQKARTKGIELLPKHLDELIAALKSPDQLPADINVFLLFIHENNT